MKAAARARLKQVATPRWCDRYLVDTNVLIAASAAMARQRGETLLSHHLEVTPDDPALQARVLAWLEDFAASPTRLVLDTAGAINIEYHRKLDFHDYGIQVLMWKLSREEVDRVEIDFDADGNGIVPQPLDDVVHDLADRKMVAAALQALSLPGTSAIAFAGDTDWHDWEPQLTRTGLTLLPLIPEWSRARHAEKQQRHHKVLHHD
jgi:hypothetical protein